MPELPPLPMREGALPVAELVDLYMAHYAGRDSSRRHRLGWWQRQLGAITLADLTDDHIHAGVEALATQHSRYYAGRDAEDRPIYRRKARPLSGATLNRYVASIAAVFTWAIRKRIAPKGWVHPCRAVERREESEGHTRFLDDAERARLLQACQAARWPRLYLLVLMAVTTGARKSELLGLRWADVDLARAVAHVGHTKNGDPKVLPLVPAVREELQRFKGAPGALVFASPRRPGQPFAFEGQWAEALRQAKVRRFRFHDCRHTCASMLAQSGATLLEIGDVLGHRQLQMTKRYSHLTTGHKAALVNRVLGSVR